MISPSQVGLVLASILGLATLMSLGCRCGEVSPQVSVPVLIAASNMMHPPFSSWDEQGVAVGMEVAIVESAAAHLGCRVHWVERPFPELLVALENREIDFAVSTIGVTEERAQRVAFSDPYFETQIVALVRNDNTAPQALHELNNKRIGADGATTSYTAAQRQWPTAQLVSAVEGGQTWSQMVQSGTIDAFVVDASDQERLQSRSGIQLRPLDPALSAEWFAVALQKDATEKLIAVNRAIREYLAQTPNDSHRD